MTQLNEQQNTQEIINSADNLPADILPADNLPAEILPIGGLTSEEGGTFVETAKQKVQLDLEDAPYLEEEEVKEEEKEEITAVATTKNTEKKTDNEDAEEPKNKKKLIIIIAAAIVLLLFLTVTAIFIFSGEEKEEIILQNIIVVPTPPAEEIPTFFQVTLDPFWIDLKNDAEGAKFLIGTFILLMESEEVKEEVEKNMKVVRDAIYYYLINAGREFLIKYENTEKIRVGINEIVNEYIISGTVTEIYFDSFLKK